MTALAALRRARDRSRTLKAAHALLREPYYGVLQAVYRAGMPVELADGIRVRLHPRLKGIRPEAYEREMCALFDREVMEGATVLDIGAHVGLHTLRLSRRVGPSGRVVAVEPSPANARLLRQHLAWNRTANVEVVEAAIGDREGEIPFTFRTDANDPGGFANSIAYDIGGETRTVPMTTIDAICAGGLTPDLIKIDVEGAELLALRGARSTLASGAPMLVVAIHPDPMRLLGTTPAELVGFLDANGYDCTRLDGSPASDPGFEDVVFRKRT